MNSMKSFDFLYNLFFRDHDIIDAILALIRGEEVQMDGFTFLLWIITIIAITFYAVRAIIETKSAKNKRKNKKR